MFFKGNKKASKKFCEALSINFERYFVLYLLSGVPSFFKCSLALYLLSGVPSFFNLTAEFDAAGFAVAAAGFAVCIFTAFAGAVVVFGVTCCAVPNPSPKAKVNTVNNFFIVLKRVKLIMCFF